MSTKQEKLEAQRAEVIERIRKLEQLQPSALYDERNFVRFLAAANIAYVRVPHFSKVRAINLDQGNLIIELHPDDDIESDSE